MPMSSSRSFGSAAVSAGNGVVVSATGSGEEGLPKEAKPAKLRKSSAGSLPEAMGHKPA